MGSGTITVATVIITGATITAVTGVASSETITVNPGTSLTLDAPKSLFLRAYNSNSLHSVTMSIGVGTEFSALGIGASSAITVATEGTTIIGGKLFESARFQTSAGTIILTQTGTGPTAWEAYQAPRAST